MLTLETNGRMVTVEIANFIIYCFFVLIFYIKFYNDQIKSF